MEDQYVVLLERVVAENVRLREELEARDNEQKRILAELGAKIERSANSGQEGASGKRKRKIPVPQQCRVSIFLSWFLVDHDCLVCCYMYSHTNAKHKLLLRYKQLVLLSVHLPLWLHLIDEPSSPCNLWFYSFVIVREAFKNLQYFVVTFPTSLEIFEFIHTSTSGNIAAK